MTPLVIKRWRITPLILICLFVAQACGTPGSETPVAEASADEGINVHGDVVFGTGTFNYPEPTAGLADLSSYKATLRLSFTGTQAGQPSQWSKIYVMLAAREPAARQLTIDKTGDLPDLDAEFMLESQRAAYELRTDQSCLASAITESQSLAEVFETAGFLFGVLGADEAGSEEINGAQAGHYTFDERALGLVDIATSTGEMWVAVEGGYILKYLLTITGTENYFGKDSEGTLTWDYELSDIDQPFTINLPEDCPPGMVDAPTLPDAAHVFAAPGMLTYTTASSIAEAAAFYQEQLPALGWSPTSEPDVFETLAVQDFTQGDQQLSVTILAEENGTTVELVLVRIQP